MATDWKGPHHTTEQGTEDWRTPQDLFDLLHAEFHFQIDAAAAPHNAMLPRYWTADDNALVQDWAAHRTVWCNPPYGRAIGEWVCKALEESAHGATVVLLTFARTDTRWWHDWAMRAAEIRLLRGRLRFRRADGTLGDAAPAPSVLLVFRPQTTSSDAVSDSVAVAAQRHVRALRSDDQPATTPSDVMGITPWAVCTPAPGGRNA